MASITDYSEMLYQTQIVNRENVIAFCIDDVFTKEECQKLIDETESREYQPALVNVGFGRQRFIPDIRKSDRCIIDDTAMAETFWSKIKQYVPNEISDSVVVGLNERMRFLRYDKGDYFAQHMDGQYVRPNGEEYSLVTFFLYLNEGYDGGASTFINGRTDVIVPCVPKTGRVLLFEPQINHEGSILKNGRKYVLRTDVMYKRKSKQ